MKLEEFNWQRFSDVWEKWWKNQLGRPVFTLQFPKPPRPSKTGLPLHCFQAHYDFSIPAGQIIRRFDENFRNEEYYADSFPNFFPNFGPGVLAAFCKGEANCTADTVWFSPGKFTDCAINDISIRLDKDCIWFRRLEDLILAAAQYWQGKVQIAMTDLGGTLDILASFRHEGDLLTDLYDAPGEVKRLTWEIHQAWWEAYDHFNRIIGGTNPGSTSWLGDFSVTGNTVFQCDFAYMISPEMFGEFVVPELIASCRRLPRSFYHLDGKGQLPHLEQLLNIPELSGIQWVPGAGQPDSRHWPEVFRKIVAAGKKAFVCVESDPEIIDEVIRQTDAPDMLQFHCYGLPQTEKLFLEKIKKYYPTT